MAIVNNIVKSLSKAISRATAKGETKTVNGLIELVENPDRVLAKINQEKAGYKAPQGNTPEEMVNLQPNPVQAPGQAIFEVEQPKDFLTPMGEEVVSLFAKATDNFKGSLNDFRKNNDIKKLFQDEDVSDENVTGLFLDSIKAIDENHAGKFKKVPGQGRVYERVSIQDLSDKIGRKAEARLRQNKTERWNPSKRREVGTVLLNYARGNLSKFIKEEVVKTQKGKNFKQELVLTTNDEFSAWVSKGGRSFMRALDGPRETRSPSTTHHGDWKIGEKGEVIETPMGSTKADFFSGGSKTEISSSEFPSVMESLNILGRQKTGMDKDFYKLNKTLGKKGLLSERAGPVEEHRALLKDYRLTDLERDELNEAFDVVQMRNDLDFGGKMTPQQFMKVKSEIFTPRLKALEQIVGDVKVKKDQFKSSQSFAKRIDEELEKRFEMDPEGKVHMQYNIDTRGRTAPIDPSGASLNSGGAIRHGFTGAKKPIFYGDEGFNQIVDDLVLFDSKANLSKIQGSGIDRHSYFLKNKDTYFKQGQDAIDNIDNPDWNPKWLKGRKDTGPYLRGVMELARIKKARESGQPYESNMLIEVDAPSSGSQHIGTQYGDEGILWQTSVLTNPLDASKLTQAEVRSLSADVPDDSIARDLYTDVGVKYKEALEKGYAKMAKTDPEKAQAFKTISDEFLRGDRGIVKPIVMKVPYGAGDDTLRLDLISQLDGRQKLAIADMGIDPDELMEFHWKNMKGSLKKGLATQYEFKKFNSVLGKIYNKSSNRKPLTVMGPAGDKTDLTRYVMGSERTFRSTIPASRVPDLAKNKPERWMGQEVTVYNSIPKDDLTASGVKQLKIDTKKIGQGMAPNVTHMMDAGFLHRLVKAANAQGMEVRVVHDAFFVHPNDVKAIKELSGQVFKDVHANYNLRQSMIEGLAEATGKSVEDITQQVKDAGLSLSRDFDIGTVPDEMLTNVIRGG